MDIYYERQRGGMCRLHSLNAYLGGPVYSDSMFWEAANEFDISQKNKFGITMSSRSFDLVNSDQRTLISFILRTRNIYTKYVAINTHEKHVEEALESGAFFVFNVDHIWIVKKNKGQWYKVDSIGGIRRINPSQLKREKNIGFMIPIHDLQREFNNLADAIHNDVRGDALTFIQENHANKKILGDVEVYLGAMMDVLRVQLADRSGFKAINTLIDRYDKFVQELCTHKRYTDLHFLEKNVPWILSTVEQLRNASK